MEALTRALDGGRMSTDGPAELVRIASVARRYYLEGMSKVDIAAELGLSRFRVARLLERGRSRGMIKIEISYPGVIDVDLSSRLQEAFDLQHAVVTNDATDGDGVVHLLPSLGRAAADLLAEIVTVEDVLGLAWSRSVSALSASLSYLAPCTVVQLTGALARSDEHDTAIELVRRVAHVSGGPAFYFYAPMIVADAVTAAALRQQPEVAWAFAQFGRVTKAVVGIGSWAPGTSTVFDAVSQGERRTLRDLGVSAEISGVLIDAEGQPIDAPLTARVMGMTADQLRAVRDVVAIAYGIEKTPAVVAALRGGLVTSLVTHGALAQALLETQQPGGTGEPV